MTWSLALTRTLRLLPFVAWGVGEVVKATGEVAWDAVTPRSRLQPGIVAYPLRSRTPAEVTLFSNLVTLTPGTLTIDVVDDPPTMFIHGMYEHDPEEFRAELRAAEDRMLWFWRGEDADQRRGGEEDA